MLMFQPVWALTSGICSDSAAPDVSSSCHNLLDISQLSDNGWDILSDMISDISFEFFWQIVCHIYLLNHFQYILTLTDTLFGLVSVSFFVLWHMVWRSHCYISQPVRWHTFCALLEHIFWWCFYWPKVRRITVCEAFSYSDKDCSSPSNIIWNAFWHACWPVVWHICSDIFCGTFVDNVFFAIKSDMLFDITYLTYLWHTVSFCGVCIEDRSDMFWPEQFAGVQGFLA